MQKSLDKTTENQDPVSRMRVGGLAILVSDLDESIKWYQNVLGMTLWNTGYFEVTYRGLPISTRLAFFEGFGTSIELLSSSGTGRKARPEPPSHLFTPELKALILWTDDFAGTLAELRARGADFVWDDMVLPDGRGCAMLADPSNNMIEVIGPPGVYKKDELIRSDIKEGRAREYPPRVDQFVGKALPRLIHNGVVLDDANGK